MGDSEIRKTGAAAGGLRDALLLPVLTALLVAAWLSFNPALFNDGDTSWHLATGRWILEHRAIPHGDPFSFTFRGHAWTAHEWLVDLLMAVAHAAAGWGGVALLFSLSAALTLALVGRELARWLPWQRALLLLALLTAVLAPFMLARPHVMAWPLLAYWTIALLKAREQDRAPPLVMALLIALWANLHASFIFGVFLAAVFGLEALVASADRKRTLLGWGMFGIAALACAFVTPLGLQCLLYPLQFSGMKALPLIDEWRPTDLREDWLFVLFAVAVAVIAAVRWRQLTLIRFLLLGILAELAFAHARHQPLFAIVSLLLLARSREGRPAAEPRMAPALLAAGLVLIALARLAMPLQRGDGPTFPATAIAKLPPALRGAPVLNSYSFGGPLILNGIAPYIDGRADMYGDGHTLDHQRIVSGDMAAFERARRRWNLGWTILKPMEPLARKLDRDPRWRRLYADEYAVIHVPR